MWNYLLFAIPSSIQHIVYSMCRATALLVPSLADLTLVGQCVQTYLRSDALAVRCAALRGLLCLLESCVKTNTTIAGLSEETLLVRNVAVLYVNQNGVVEER